MSSPVAPAGRDSISVKERAGKCEPQQLSCPTFATSPASGRSCCVMLIASRPLGRPASSGRRRLASHELFVAHSFWRQVRPSGRQRPSRSAGRPASRGHELGWAPGKAGPRSAQNGGSVHERWRSRAIPFPNYGGRLFTFPASSAKPMGQNVGCRSGAITIIGTAALVASPALPKLITNAALAV